MNDIHVGKGRDWELTYTQEDGSPGTVDVAKNPTRFEVQPAGFATITVGAFDAATGKQVIGVDHNGSLGDTTVTVINDGDLGSGEVQIVATETFTMVQAGGAVAVSSSVGAERPTV
jgi:hypothetical protein